MLFLTQLQKRQEHLFKDYLVRSMLSTLESKRDVWMCFELNVIGFMQSPCQK